MKLDEVERILRGVADGRTPDEHGRRVLRAAVAVLPVVKAAEEWERSLAEPNGGRRRIKEHDALWALKCRLDDMRRKMEE